MCTNPRTLRYPASVNDRLRGVFTDGETQVPCGKCAECMKKKQNSIRFRVMHEAQKAGKMDFLTLTYNNDTLPISHSLWSVERDSGEMSLYGEPLVCKDVPQYVRQQIVGDFESERQHKMKSLLVKHEFSDFDSERDYFLSYSPSHNYDDVKNCFKRIRKYYHDLTGKNADFSYLCVPEFGEHYSRRPHYHLCLFGAPELFVHFFVRAWSEGFYKPKAKLLQLHPKQGLSRSTFCTRELAIALGIENFRCYQPLMGFIDSRHVNAVNEDGSSGFAKCANYIGKYVGKGVFEDALVKDGFIHLPRIGISKHFGQLPDDMVRWHLCKDIFGDYDDKTLSDVPEEKLNQIVPAVVRRLIHSYNGKDYALPIQFLNQIFQRSLALSRNQFPSYLKDIAFSFSEWPPSGKTYYSALFYKVKDFIRDTNLQTAEREFEQFVAHYPTENLYQAVAAFEAIQRAALQVREKNALAAQRKSLQQSKL